MSNTVQWEVLTVAYSYLMYSWFYCIDFCMVTVQCKKNDMNLPLASCTLYFTNMLHLTIDSMEEDEEARWLSMVGSDKVLKIANITKTDPHAGLGFKMETTVEVDDTGQPQIGRHCSWVLHVI